jgi:uncharacterized membrane protein
MSELQQVLQHLKQPEYVHVLLNPMPVYGLVCGVLALLLAVLFKNKQAQIVGLVVVVFASASAWPVAEYGERSYDRVYSMSNPEAQQWLDVHAHRAGQFVYAFYVTAVLGVVALLSQWKLPKLAAKLTVVTLLAAIVSLGIGGWIGHAGGQVRHSEFRDGPPPVPVKPHEHEKD